MSRASRLFMVKEVRTARASIFTRLTSLTLQQKVELKRQERGGITLGRFLNVVFWLFRQL